MSGVMKEVVAVAKNKSRSRRFCRSCLRPTDYEPKGNKVTFLEVHVFHQYNCKRYLPAPLLKRWHMLATHDERVQ